MYLEGPNSVTQWIADLKTGNADAARRLAERYWTRLEAIARKRLGDAPRGISDEEDVVVSVLASLCRGVAAGRFAELSSREDLWWLLLAITKQKTVDHIRREGAQKRGGGRDSERTGKEVRSQSNIFPLDQLISNEPTAEFLVQLEEEHQRLMMLLRDQTLRRIAIWRMDGYSVQEIADRLSTGTRAVERKLALIRKKWEREFQQ